MNLKKILACAACALALSTVGLAEGEATNEKSAALLKLEKFVLPEYPENLRQQGVTQGSVTIAIGCDNEGNVNDVLVLASTNARFTNSVTNAATRWKFKFPVEPAANNAGVLPVVRVLFSAKGVQIVQAITGTLANPENKTRPDAPIQLPSVADLDQPFKPISQPMPRITALQRSRVGDGLVTVKYFIDTTGQVRVPVVLEASTPELGQAAQAALAKWQFAPPKVAGRPTIAINTETFRFGTRAQL